MKSTAPVRRLLVLGCLLAMAAPLAAQDRIPWITDLRQARDVAERQNRLVLLHFWSQDCAPCKRLERYVFNQPEFIRALTTGYIPVKINVQAQPRLAKFYNVSSWPTDVIVTPEGREIQRFTSKQDSNAYIAMLDGIRARASVNGYIPVANRNSRPGAAPTAGQAYGGSAPANESAAIGQNDTATNPSAEIASLPNHYGNRYVNPLDRNMAPQPQDVAPRYANPYEASADASSNSGESPWMRNQESANAGASQPGQPTPNPYVAEKEQTQSALRQQTLPQRSSNMQQNQWSQNTPPQSTPARNQNPNPSKPQHASAPAANDNQHPPVVLEGYCPVTLVHKRGWAKGDKRWGANHEGRIYLFAGPEEQKAFLANPNLYAPLLSGYDPVQYAESGQLVPGRREFGLYIDEPGPIALFADEAALQRFHSNAAYYFNAIRQAQRQQPSHVPQR